MERLLQIIGDDCNSYSDRVLVEETEYLENFLTLVEKLPNVCKKYEDSGHKIACIIVDSITALMRLEYEAKGKITLKLRLAQRFFLKIRWREETCSIVYAVI